MIHDKMIVVVMPAYNAEKTLEAVLDKIPFEFVDDLILVDDASQDRTAELSRELGIRTTVHLENLGYGANQKTCYKAALASGADVIIMLHPDYSIRPSCSSPWHLSWPWDCTTSFLARASCVAELCAEICRGTSTRPIGS